MKSKTCVSLAVIVSLLTGSPAFAQGRPDDGRDSGPGYHDQQQRDYGHDRGNRQRDDRPGKQMNRNARDDDWRGPDGYARGDDDRHGRGAGPQQSFYRGDRLPNEYRGRTYVVDDWRGHHLRQPPRGYHWVQVGGDYVLAAIATGIIVDLLLLNHR